MLQAHDLPLLTSETLLGLLARAHSARRERLGITYLREALILDANAGARPADCTTYEDAEREEKRDDDGRRPGNESATHRA